MRPVRYGINLSYEAPKCKQLGDTRWVARRDATRRGHEEGQEQSVVRDVSPSIVPFTLTAITYFFAKAKSDW